MKKLIFILAVTVMITCTPSRAEAVSVQTADVSPAALAPSQRDINIAVLVVILGSVLVGYEKIARERESQADNAHRRSKNE